MTHLKASVLSYNLKSAVDKAHRVMPRKTRRYTGTSKVVRIVADDASITLSVLDKELMVQSFVASGKVDCDGTVFVLFESLRDFIVAVTKKTANERLDLELNGDTLSIRFHDGNTSLKAFNSDACSDDIWEPIDNSSFVMLATINARLLSKALADASKHVAKNDDKPVLKDYLFVPGCNQVEIAATQGYTASAWYLDCTTHNHETLEYLIPASYTGALKTLLKNYSWVDVESIPDRRVLRFTANDGGNKSVADSLVVLCSEGTFPDYKRFIPGEEQRSALPSVDWDKADFSRGLRLINVFAKKNLFATDIVITCDQLKIIASSQGLGDIEHVLDCRTTGIPDYQTLFFRANTKYLSMINKGSIVLVDIREMTMQFRSVCDDYTHIAMLKGMRLK